MTAYSGLSFESTPPSRGALKQGLRFPGQYYDAETGTHYNYFRDYDPAIGRYEQSDPIGLRGGLNIFSYATADPLRRSDATGLLSGSLWPLARQQPANACSGPPPCDVYYCRVFVGSYIGWSGVVIARVKWDCHGGQTNVEAGIWRPDQRDFTFFRTFSCEEFDRLPKGGPLPPGLSPPMGEPFIF
jgi:RHS repeat-associated protein